MIHIELYCFVWTLYYRYLALYDSVQFSHAHEKFKATHSVMGLCTVLACFGGKILIALLVVNLQVCPKSNVVQ